MHRGADVFNKGRIADVSKVGSGPCGYDGNSGSEAGKRGTNMLYTCGDGKRLRLLAASARGGQAGAIAGNNREYEAGERKLPDAD